MLVGKYLGVKDLGVYRVGWQISAIIFGTLLRPIVPVIYSAFSRLQANPAKMKQTYRKINRIIISISLPVGAILFMIGTKSVFLTFGESWHGLGMVVGTIGLMHGAAWIVNINPEMYRAIGRPDLNTKLMIATILYYLPAYLITAPLGLKVFAYTRLGVGVLAIPIHVLLCIRVFGISFHSLWKDWQPMVISTIAMAAMIWVLLMIIPINGNDAARLINLAIIIVSGVVIYGFTLLCLDKKFIFDSWKIFKTALMGSNGLTVTS